MKFSLVGDIGGTNARLALWRGQGLEAVQVLQTADFPEPVQAVRAYLQEQNLLVEDLEKVCLACAGPVQGDEFHFTNNHWRLSRSAFAQELDLKRLLLINDFAAMALGMTRLQQGEWIDVCKGEAELDRPRLVIGPGTGLGVASLVPKLDGGWIVLPGEGGHVSLPIGSSREAALWEVLHRHIGHVEAESVLCGKGLLRLYQAICELDRFTPHLQTPADVTTAALAGDTCAAGALGQFCVWLGRVAGDSALTLGARGGVYLAGGMLPRFADFLMTSGFLQGFHDKGQMTAYVEGIPVQLVTAKYPGLEGACVALELDMDT
ncbi:glucokinase [Azomonas macrocytogenes]|uniref:Glucokinase n=1 Tax=Azomonas macrocytogenes TaxID=69962 RepID=A0A839T3M5_AZOMA|nr:glucokinase [Azomonas macrocytogenes]MBB3103609.1 glucokinase [Azomonas macrocytogenes]